MLPKNRHVGYVRAVPTLPKSLPSSLPAPLLTKAEIFEKRKTVHSSFLITVNTNKVPRDQEHNIGLSNGLYDAYEKIFGNPNQPRSDEEDIRTWKKLLVPLSPNAKKVQDNDGNEDSFSDIIKYNLIRDIKSSASVEIGEKAKGGRNHMHIVFSITHKSRLHIDWRFIRDVFREELEPFGVTNPMVNIHGFSNSEQSALDYVWKKFHEKN